MAAVTAVETTTEKKAFRFLSAPDDSLKCVICLGVAEDPWQHDKCGKLFCEYCLEDWKYSDEPLSSACPYCRDKKPCYFSDIKSKREINDLSVKCMASVKINSSTKRCCWRGTYGALEEHYTKCDCTLQCCPNWCGVKDKNGQEKKFLRKALEEHLLTCPEREAKCDLCGEKDTFEVISNKHESNCPMKVVACTNSNCSTTMPRKTVKRHLKECEYSEVPCKYFKLGCDVKMMRRDIAAHEKDSDGHLQMSIDTITRLQNRLDQQNEENGSITFKITNFTDKKFSEGRVKSQPFYTHPEGYRVVAEVIFKEREDFDDIDEFEYLWGLTIKAVEGDYDDKLKWPAKGDAVFSFLNQEKDCDHHTETVELSLKHYRERDYRIPNYSSIPFLMFFSRYSKNDTVYVKVTVEMDGHKSWLHVQ